MTYVPSNQGARKGICHACWKLLEFPGAARVLIENTDQKLWLCPSCLERSRKRLKVVSRDVFGEVCRVFVEEQAERRRRRVRKG